MGSKLVEWGLHVVKYSEMKYFTSCATEHLGIEPGQQRLIYSGKQLERDCKLSEYKIERGMVT